MCFLQWELSMVLYPVFVQMYLELVYNNHEREGDIITHKVLVSIKS